MGHALGADQPGPMRRLPGCRRRRFGNQQRRQVRRDEVGDTAARLAPFRVEACAKKATPSRDQLRDGGRTQRRGHTLSTNGRQGWV